MGDSNTLRECPICLTFIDDSKLFRTPCGHSYHISCLHTAVNHCTVKACPMCRDSNAVTLLLHDDSTVPADSMTWPCSVCGGGTPDSGALLCEGSKCLLDSTAGVWAWDARAKCYTCAGVCAASAAGAAPFVCKRCER
jgi:hypothetical protein